jgi:hypothetical protein
MEMTNKEFWVILKKPANECDEYELRLRHLWENNNSRAIFEITGLDFSNLLCKKQAVDYLKESEKNGNVKNN